MLQGDKNNPFNNSEGYPNPTAYYAMKSMDQEEHKHDEHELDKKVHNLVNVLKFIVDWAGFEFIGRIQIRHKKTKKEFK